MRASVKPINNQDEAGSTAFMFDLQNSTNVTRKISWDKRLVKHIDFMMDMHKHIYKKLYDNCDPSKFAMNDTGDGYICVFWDSSHALTCLRMAIHVKEFLDKKLTTHNTTLGFRDKSLKLDYGFALHSGGSTIKRTTFYGNDLQVSKDFIFGIVANTVSRLESFTKTYVDYNFLVTGNYRDVFNEQNTSEEIKSLFTDGSQYYKKSLGRVNLKDGKANGHNIYALTEGFLSIFREHYDRKNR